MCEKAGVIVGISRKKIDTSKYQTNAWRLVKNRKQGWKEKVKGSFRLIRNDATIPGQRRLDNLDQFPDENRGFVVGRGPERATTQRFRVDLHRCNSIYQHMHRVQGYILLVGKFFREFRENKFANWGIFEFVPRINQLINVTLKILSGKLLFESRFLGFYTSFPNMISE